MDHKVAETGPESSLGTACQDQEGSTDREHLPEDKEGEHVTGEDGANGSSSVNGAGNILYGVINVQGIECRKESDQMEDITEDQAQFVNSGQDDLVT